MRKIIGWRKDKMGGKAIMANRKQVNGKHNGKEEKKKMMVPGSEGKESRGRQQKKKSRRKWEGENKRWDEKMTRRKGKLSYGIWWGMKALIKQEEEAKAETIVGKRKSKTKDDRKLIEVKERFNDGKTNKYCTTHDNEICEYKRGKKITGKNIKKGKPKDSRATKRKLKHNDKHKK